MFSADLFFQRNDCNSCKFIWSIESTSAHRLPTFLGNIFYFMQVWIPVVVNAMLGGERSWILV